MLRKVSPRVKMMISRRFEFSLVFLMNTCFVVAASRSTQMLGQKGGHQNLTLTFNETFEFRFSADTVNDSHNIVVHVMHQSRGEDLFDTRCVIRQSRENCTSSANMCRCLREPFGSYILHKIITKDDSGIWTFKQWNTQRDVINILDINVEVENKTKLASGSMKDDTKSTLSTITVVIISIFAVSTVTIISYLVIRFLVKTTRRDQMTTSASTPPSQAPVQVAQPLSATVSLELTSAAPSVSAPESPAPVLVTLPLTEKLLPELTPEAQPLSATASPAPVLSLLLTEALESAPSTSAPTPLAPTLPAQPSLAPATASSLATAPVPQSIPPSTILTKKPLPPPKPSTTLH